MPVATWLGFGEIYTPSRDGRRLKTSHFIRRFWLRRPRPLLKVNVAVFRRVQGARKAEVAGRKSLVDEKMCAGVRRGLEWGAVTCLLLSSIPPVIGASERACRFCSLATDGKRWERRPETDGLSRGGFSK